MGYFHFGKKGVLALLGAVALSTAAQAAEEVTLDDAFNNIQELQSKLSNHPDVQVRGLLPLLDRTHDVLTQFDRDHGGRMQGRPGGPGYPGNPGYPGRPGHPGGGYHPHPGPGPRPYPGPHPGPGPRPGPRPGYEPFYCVAVDRGFEEHRGGHYGQGCDERAAAMNAMAACLRYHGHCRLTTCGRR